MQVEAFICVILMALQKCALKLIFPFWEQNTLCLVRIWECFAPPTPQLINATVK